MKKIKTHIFSFDRPAQLELLLNSIIEFDINQQLKVTVQYSYSNDAFKQGYEILKNRFPSLTYLEEVRFELPKYTNPFFGMFSFNLLLWLKNHRYRKASSNFRKLLLKSLDDNRFKYFMFLTDDSLFYRKIEISNNILNKISENKSSAFSLSMGENIEGGEYLESKNYIEWNTIQKIENNIWTYAFSVDGRIYNRVFLNKVASKLLYTNPNTFECVMVFYNKFLKIFSKIYANKQSCLIGFEINQVQNQYNNNHFAVSHSKINEYFQKNYHLQIDFISPVTQFRPEIIGIKMNNNRDTVSLN